MEFMTLAQAAKAAGVSYFTMRDWVVVRNLIPYRRLGKRLIRVNKADVMEFIHGPDVKKSNTDD